jgi:hypothetical protein
MRIVSFFAILILPWLSHSVTAAALMDANPEYVKVKKSASPPHALVQQEGATQQELARLEQEKSITETEAKNLYQQIVDATKNVAQLEGMARITEGFDDSLLQHARSRVGDLKQLHETSLKRLADLSTEIGKVKVSLSEFRNNILGSGNDCVPTAGGGKIFCRQMQAKNEFFADLGISPTLADGGEIKLGALRGFIDLGEDKEIPLSVLIADVTSQTQSEEANAIKLLDPEQGINLTSEYAWRYRVGGICAGETTARCMLGFNYGVRYLNLQKENTDQPKSSFGVFTTLKTSLSFNIFRIGDDGIHSKDSRNKLGTIRVHGAYSYFHHDGGSSDEYFAGIADSDGNPVQFDREFGSIRYGITLYVNESINFTYVKYSARGADGVMDDESISLNFDVLKIK